MLRSSVSRYQLWRRRLAPVGFALAIALLAREACNKEHRTHATVVLDFGSAAADVRAVDAEVFVDGASVARFHRAAVGGAIGDAKFEAALPGDDAEMKLDIELGARHVAAIRKLHLVEGSTLTVPLADALQK